MTPLRLFPYQLILTPSDRTLLYLFNLPSETYGEVTGPQRKAVGTQIPKVHGADKVEDLMHMPDTQARREGIPKPIQVDPKFISQPHRRVPPFLPKGQGRAGGRRNIIGPRLQPIPHPKSKPALLPT